MKRLHSFPLIIAALAVLVGTALAAGSRGTIKPTALPERIAATEIPDECRAFATVPADSRSETLPWELRISLAACRQSVVLVPTSDPAEYPALIARIDRAMQPSIAMYHDAIARGPTPQLRILATYGLGMTYLDSIVRARSAVYVVDAATRATYGGATYAAAVDSYQRLHGPLEPLLAGHRNAAIAAFREVVRLADEHPAAARANPVMTFVVADARTKANLLQPAAETAPNVTRR